MIRARVVAMVRRDWDATVERFLDGLWERGVAAVGVVLTVLTVVAVAAELGRRLS